MKKILIILLIVILACVGGYLWYNGTFHMLFSEKLEDVELKQDDLIPSDVTDEQEVEKAITQLLKDIEDVKVASTKLLSNNFKVYVPKVGVYSLKEGGYYFENAVETIKLASTYELEGFDNSYLYYTWGLKNETDDLDFDDLHYGFKTSKRIPGIEDYHDLELKNENITYFFETLEELEATAGKLSYKNKDGLFTIDFSYEGQTESILETDGKTFLNYYEQRLNNFDMGFKGGNNVELLLNHQESVDKIINFMKNKEFTKINGTNYNDYGLPSNLEITEMINEIRAEAEKLYTVKDEDIEVDLSLDIENQSQISGVHIDEYGPISTIRFVLNEKIYIENEIMITYEDLLTPDSFDIVQDENNFKYILKVNELVVSETDGGQIEDLYAEFVLDSQNRPVSAVIRGVGKTDQDGVNATYSFEKTSTFDEDGQATSVVKYTFESFTYTDENNNQYILNGTKELNYTKLNDQSTLYHYIYLRLFK